MLMLRPMRIAIGKRLRCCAVLMLLASLAGCGLLSGGVERAKAYAEHVGGIGRYGKLTEKETQWAKIAWRYFENNTNPENGLVNGSDRTPTFSMWHLGDYLAALVAAREIELIDAHEFDARLSRVLAFLQQMDLSEASVPGKVYNALTGKMVSYDNKPADIGWSAVETGRLLAWMRIVGERYPQYREYVDKVVFRMNFCQVIDDCGAMYGVSIENGKRNRYQEGRLGYEQVGAAGFAAWGFDARRLWREPETETVNIYGIPVQYDARESRLSGVQTPVLTMPYVLLGMEYGFRYPGEDTAGATDWRGMADAVYKVQALRHEREGVLTARTDYALREPPYLVYDAVFAAGYAFNTVGPDGKEYPKLAMVSTRAAFGMWVLWPGEYTDLLMRSVQTLYSAERGWFDGRMENSGAARDSIGLTTNAEILEVLLFKLKGTLLPEPGPARYLARQTADPYDRPNRCFPAERPACVPKPQARALVP
ncbi:DUF3131 domain-containing protein [Noviherbaspirillum pedocola]|uniref:DUF3131 domain-containing protein n=1 Tax=Noviherbaspirillum pedocola TaxID=2801341 RepID=A0A934W1N9_9BURK|nr:DUF3131 domain-containing protein [Noviherbaspirillum pedocola]MBK4735401.1 DUF3131 domain-containing protein [Noviherbaspirillum pedocola]